MTSYRDEYGKRYEITVGDHDTYTSQHQISHDICRQFPDIKKDYKIHILHTDAELKAFVAYRLVEKLEYENEMILSKEKIRRLMDNNRFLIAFLNFLRSSLKTGILVHIENEIVKAHRSKNGEISELLKTRYCRPDLQSPKPSVHQGTPWRSSQTWFFKEARS